MTDFPLCHTPETYEILTPSGWSLFLYKPLYM